MRKRAPLLERLWSRVDTSDPQRCWRWLGSPAGRYGQIKRTRDHLPVGVHRISYELAYGSIPTGLFVLHRCDTPLCVRPTHLFLGTQADNVNDARAKGRLATGDRNGARTKPEQRQRGADHWQHRTPEKAARGERSGGSKLTADKVRDIRQLRSEGWTLEALASEYGVRIGTIHFVVTRKTWAHVE